MSAYEVEHNIAKSPDQAEPPKHARRPDLSTFFSNVDQIETPSSQINEHAVPTPEMMTAVFRELANGYDMMRQDNGGQDAQTELLDQMIDMLRHSADDPPEKVEGVPDTFIDGLERVPTKRLKKSDDCPICGNPFLEDEYPLVVVLPCHPDHKFDLDCIRPWLKLNPTCPLDRKDLLKKKAPPPPPDDDEEDYDDYYA